MNHTSPIPTLLTGFGAFPGVETNPTAGIVARIAARAAANLHAAVLPVSWRRGPSALQQALAQATDEIGRPALLLHLGVAAGADRLRLESTAAALARPSVDVDGELAAAAPPSGDAEFDVPSVVAALQAIGLPATVSDDAGGYLCNAIFGLGLQWAREHGAIAAFLHVPMPGSPWPDGSGRCWTEADLDAATTCVLNALGAQLGIEG